MDNRATLYINNGENIRNILSNLNNNTSFQNYFDNDINDMLDEIAEQYDNTNGDNQFSFVPSQNYVNNIYDKFTYEKQLGCGASCHVLLVTDKTQNKQYALKEMQKSDSMNKLLFETEYKILNKLNGHQNILSYDSAFIDENCYYLSTTYHSGGTMLDRILEKKSFSELECAQFIKHALNGLQFMHENKIVHRDIKCENLIFNSKEKDDIVIIDFGNSEIITNGNEIDNKIIGTLHYLSPELLSSKKRTKQQLYKGDMWSIGVVCYVLCTGKVPFYGDNQKEILASIRKGTFTWPKACNLSESCKDFISSLLCVNSNERLDCAGALQHEWIKGKASDALFGDKYLDQIKIFSKTNKLQKILVNSVLSEMDKKDKYVLLKALRDLNMNGKFNDEINQNVIINYVLMHGQLNSNQTMKCNKMNEFEGFDIENILNEIDEVDAVEDNMIYLNNNYSDSWSEMEQIEKHKLNFYDFSSIQSESFDSDSEVEINSKISIEKFNRMISNSDEEYDVKTLVNSLKPTDSGNIFLKNINQFNGTIPSKSKQTK